MQHANVLIQAIWVASRVCRLQYPSLSALAGSKRYNEFEVNRCLEIINKRKSSLRIKLSNKKKNNYATTSGINQQVVSGMFRNRILMMRAMRSKVAKDTSSPRARGVMGKVSENQDMK
ncbi:hypothetical protein SERLA73DRAFT_157191 [Serpula lacrymans var. lacrymans S7.3]|uniref:Uncharacterized protein n=1 Tax=Serpula lacrymans var. lacrymans (strain S7.3) TaxID=936435 RepID=F8QHW2_SERL3|nr:hypothetical protein SERLA73DRAFT_157191 [Serpula lacrymans var. lacrymans S7.3]